MPNMQQLLNDEIRRLARREINAAVKTVKAQMVEMRRTIAEQNRRIKALESNLPAPAPQTADPAPETADAETKTLRITPERIAKWRQKLQLNKSQYAKLLGVNTMSVIHWESGKTAPRDAQKLRIAALRDMGKRELAKLMAEKDIAPKLRRSAEASDEGTANAE